MVLTPTIVDVVAAGDDTRANISPTLFGGAMIKIDLVSAIHDLNMERSNLTKDAMDVRN